MLLFADCAIWLLNVTSLHATGFVICIHYLVRVKLSISFVKKTYLCRIVFLTGLFFLRPILLNLHSENKEMSSGWIFCKN